MKNLFIILIFLYGSKESRQKSSFLTGQAIKALPPPLGLYGSRIF